MKYSVKYENGETTYKVDDERVELVKQGNKTILYRDGKPVLETSGSFGVIEYHRWYRLDKILKTLYRMIRHRLALARR